MIRSLREERGREKMSVHNTSHKRADLATIPKPFTGGETTNGSTSTDAADRDLAAAQQHRDKLLTFQTQNAQRTHIIDEAADYETPSSGQSMWSSPVERAAQLKRQQKVLREQEWNAQPEWQKKQVVVSIDLVGGKAVRRMAEVERPKEKEESYEIKEDDRSRAGSGEGAESKGALSHNPLLGGLVRPVWKSKGDATGDAASTSERRKRDQWRRVQDDEDDNEAWILDGGVYGYADAEHRILGTEERAQG